MGLSEGERNKVLDAWTGRTNYTANAAVWAKLHTGAPGAAGTSNAAAATTRKQVAWAAASGGVVANSGAATWSGGDLTTTETITHLSFWTASSDGTYLGDAALGSSAGVSAGETLNFAAGQITQTLTGTKMATGEMNKALDAWAGTATYTASAAFCAKLHTGDPGSAGTSNASADTTRKAITFGSAASAGAISSTAPANWTNLQVGGGETLSWLSFWSSVTNGAGTFLGRDDLATSRTVTTGDGLDIATGDIDLTAS